MPANDLHVHDAKVTDNSNADSNTVYKASAGSYDHATPYVRITVT